MQRDKFLPNFLTYLIIIFLANFGIFLLSPLAENSLLFSIFVDVFSFFCLPLAIILILQKKFPKTSVLIIFFFLLFYNFLKYYELTTNNPFDLRFIVKNFLYSKPILQSYSYLLIFAVLSSIITAWALSNLANLWRTSFIKKKYFLEILIILLLVLSGAAGKTNTFNRFILTLVGQNKIIAFYHKNIQPRLIVENINNKSKILEKANEIKNAKTSKNLHNLIFLQIESVNAALVSPEITPNLLKIAKDGIFFSKHYANNIETITSQENIFCSLPPSYFPTATQSGYDKDILCLPQIFNSLGFKTFFFKTYDLNFTRTGEFMRNIGFSEVHADDIMQSDDPRTAWGYREDIFFDRVFAYLEKNKTPKNNFIYLEIGPTNHWPFITPQDYFGLLPFPDAQSHRERLANTTFIQDSYLRDAYAEIQKLFPQNDFTLFLLSDHSWPAEIHPDNTFNQNNAYEENFLTSLVVVPGDLLKNSGCVIQTQSSHMDILPSLLKLYGLGNFFNAYTSDMALDLKQKGIKNNANILQIQPYGMVHLNIIDSTDHKYQFQNNNKNVKIFNLLKDELETESQTTTKRPDSKLIKRLLP